MDLQLDGRVAVVTGASRGIGRAVAEALVAEGVRVALCARGEADLAAAGTRLRSHPGAEVLVQVADVGHAGEVEALIGAAAERWGRLDILVNNAGGPPPGTFGELSDDDWRQAVERTLMSVVRAVRAAVPHLSRCHAGRVINVLSTSAVRPLDGMLLSNSLRTAVAGLARTLSRELGPAGITVNNVCPGHVLTARLREVAAWRAAHGEAVDPRKAVAAIPLGRFGSPRDVATLVTFLASGAAAYVTGATIPVDGGASA